MVIAGILRFRELAVARFLQWLVIRMGRMHFPFLQLNLTFTSCFYFVGMVAT